MKTAMLPLSEKELTAVLAAVGLALRTAGRGTRAKPLEAVLRRLEALQAALQGADRPGTHLDNGRA